MSNDFNNFISNLSSRMFERSRVRCTELHNFVIDDYERIEFHFYEQI